MVDMDIDLLLWITVVEKQEQFLQQIIGKCVLCLLFV